MKYSKPEKVNHYNFLNPDPESLPKGPKFINLSRKMPLAYGRELLKNGLFQNAQSLIQSITAQS